MSEIESPLSAAAGSYPNRYPSMARCVKPNSVVVWFEGPPFSSHGRRCPPVAHVSPICGHIGRPPKNGRRRWSSKSPSQAGLQSHSVTSVIRRLSGSKRESSGCARHSDLGYDRVPYIDCLYSSFSSPSSTHSRYCCLLHVVVVVYYGLPHPTSVDKKETDRVTTI
ncbi:hypothetical protein GWI33_001515 [Rhynchophorus ferrugineus]|uniref:Uncharacterized protein n=1 Tax=Rhynchophorus ferrugineus TaxID=354439 RepID=A0A834IS14_RHYFE|nr:hypothetical protein GWI33_001515 [Rhynchophorus ferrugineus]